MKNIYRIRIIFVRQLNENDCGIACLCMVLNYTGQKDDAKKLRSDFIVPKNGVSLLQLKDLAGEFHLLSKCVQMDVAHLRLIDRPTILHLANENGTYHYQVCFGAVLNNKSYRYLMADPAHQVYFLSEDLLLKQWESHTALVFDHLTESKSNRKITYWAPLFSLARFPKWLFITFALISIFTAFFGIAITWVLQSGINDPLSGRKNSIVFATVILLLIISLFKSVLGYIKQQIMVTVSLQINEQLTLKFLTRVCSFDKISRMQISQSAIKMVISDIQKIQNAISLLMGTLMADGTLILFSLFGLCYIAPISAAITLMFLTGSFFISVKNLPALLYQNSSLNGLAGNYETSLLNLVQGTSPARTNPDTGDKAPHLEIHNRYIRFARAIADKLGRINLLSECLGTLNVIMVIALGLASLRNETISYTSFTLAVILTYFVSTLMAKITGTLYAISDGSDAAIQFGNNTSD